MSQGGLLHLEPGLGQAVVPHVGLVDSGAGLPGEALDLVLHVNQDLFAVDKAQQGFEHFKRLAQIFHRKIEFLKILRNQLAEQFI